MNRLIYIMTMLFLFQSCLLSANGLEFRLTLSGKVLLGIAYRHQLDSNTAIRLGPYLGIAGAPVGLHIGMVQDTTPSKEWTPFFEIGGDVIIFKQKDKITYKFYPSGSVGLAYRPTPYLKHSGELWLGWLSGELRPVGLSYVHFNSIN